MKRLCSILSYRLHDITQRWKVARDARKESRHVYMLLRENGFNEVAPGRWEKR